MTEEELANAMRQRLLAAQSPLGRWKLRFYVSWKRVAWRMVTGIAHFIKRLMDIVISIFAIIVLSPALICIALMVKADGGPIIFKQKRYGLHGKEFYMWKFRSMCVDAEAKLAELLKHNQHKDGITFRMENDPRVTKIGRFIRKSSIDELPQFVNVLRGEMSIVGPRPPIEREVALYDQEDRNRFKMKPGITCLWQVGGRQGGLFEIGSRHSIDFKEQVSLDIRYIESQSFWRDVWILLKTIPAIVFGKEG